jgi:hypothetical protein
LGKEEAEEGNEQGGGGAFSWEVRLVQEFCDLGSLRDALKGGKQFRWAALSEIGCEILESVRFAAFIIVS